MKYSRKIEVLKMIVDDMENDAKNFSGLPFNGKTVGEYFGNQGAAISALADIIKSLLEREARNKETEMDGQKMISEAERFNEWLKQVVEQDDRFKHLLVPGFEEEHLDFYNYFERDLSPWQALQEEYQRYALG